MWDSLGQDLSCIYVQELQSDESLNPYWPMWYALMKNDIYPAKILNKTLKKAGQKKGEFK